MLITKDLSFAFPGAAPLQFPDIHCELGEQWLLLGQSGSGKTTMLHLLAGLRRPKSGRVQVLDTVISNMSTSQLDRFRGQNIGLIFQQSHFVKALTVGENLALARRLAGLPNDQRRINELLDQLNIGNKRDQRPQSLSVGEQQRAAIARALINEPTVILADEPTSALDDDNTERVIELLKTQAAAVHATLLVVTHDNRLKSTFDQQISL
ncbi:MAG: ATP-binding cassette domain-containing protein [Bacteroidota bacterium]